jgi:hypothetical protein
MMFSVRRVVPGTLLVLGFLGCASESTPRGEASRAERASRRIETRAQGTAPVRSRAAAPRPEITCEIARVASERVWLPVGRRDGVTGHDRFFVTLPGEEDAEAVVENLWDHGASHDRCTGDRHLKRG